MYIQTHLCVCMYTMCLYVHVWLNIHIQVCVWVNMQVPECNDMDDGAISSHVPGVTVPWFTLILVARSLLALDRVDQEIFTVKYFRECPKTRKVFLQNLYAFKLWQTVIVKKKCSRAFQLAKLFPAKKIFLQNISIKRENFQIYCILARLHLLMIFTRLQLWVQYVMYGLLYPLFTLLNGYWRYKYVCMYMCMLWLFQCLSEPCFHLILSFPVQRNGACRWQLLHHCVGRWGRPSYLWQHQAIYPLPHFIQHWRGCMVRTPSLLNFSPESPFSL